MPNDFLRDIDLNPTIGAVAAPVMQPDDPRAMFYFGFTAKGQELRNLSTFRVLASFSYANRATQFTGGPFPPPDAILNAGDTIRYDLDHDRAHVLVWIDPSGGLPPMGTVVEVRVRAWA